MKDVAVRVDHVSMKYKLMSGKVNSLKQVFINAMTRKITYEEFSALEDVSFEIQKGEVFGVVGLNGAGKSTLLKIVAGIIKPTSGAVERFGSLVPLIELGGGFNAELTGFENIYLNGMLLGYSKKFIKERTNEIIEFSELEKFIHTPLKNYSSGMKARLGFAIATLVKPEILIVDEVLSVGDYKFKEKSEAKMKSLMSSGTTVLFVSHSIEQMKSMCNRVLWLDQGRVKEIGPAVEVCEKYQSQ
ncbi:teichoic acid ABC transporter ATP-binding protein [Paenibacillus sp. Root52]|uniref:ABC-type polysaccharide/polyol phosphate transport system ATPase subunit n=1 Tax=Paenibacillus amylolyticus TaxID=1451 RepID=A0AAP5H597_PAEAM|nr:MULTISPECIES: ABC transporter ATP-binding protein [Paenibacillus]KQY91998.1 teichoic acid ABC transporter ATP-binding protein [Paenibacillus sp. Root52]MDR6726594.1 ABC-type polysaccharide/polyol phosphate transport system ATPase subunit [Paenibacillus amylolyticus]